MPNNGVRPQVAVVGCGMWGKNLVRNFAELGALSAVVDDSDDLGSAVGQEFDVPHLTLNQVLEDPTIDALVVATPPVTHPDIAIAALDVGKHVFVEKPLALTVEEAVRIEQAGRRAGRVVMVGHLLRYHPAFLALKDLVDDGALGRVLHIDSMRLNFGRIRQEENSLWSFAPHDIAMILELVGSEPDRVHAVGSNFLHQSIADVTTTHLSFPTGQSALIHVSWLHPLKEQRLTVVGDRGMAVFDDGQPWETKLRLYRNEVQWKAGLPTPKKSEVEPIAIVAEEPLRRECEHFLARIVDGRPPLTDAADGIRVLKVLHAAQQTMADPFETRQGGVSHEGVDPTATVDPGVVLGEGTKVWHYSHIIRGSVVGRDCVIGQNVMIGPDVKVGDNCKIQNNVSVYAGVTLEDGVFCGPSAVFTNVLTPRSEWNRKDEFAPTLVRRGATIGANATVVCGNTIGAYSMIGAGAVVTKDVPDHALVVGNPARQIGWVSHAGERLQDDLVCPRTGDRYVVNGDRLRRIDGSELRD